MSMPRNKNEYWLNAYYYAPMNTTFVGDEKFKYKTDAMAHVPSYGLVIAYRIHVRLK